MSVSGIIILAILSLFAVYCTLGKKGKGVRHYIIKPSLGIYVLLLGLLALLRASFPSIVLLFSAIAILCAIYILFIGKKDIKKLQVVIMIGIITGSLATFLSYVN